MKNKIVVQVIKTGWILLFFLVISSTGWAESITVKIENIAVGNATRITPVWIGLHDGSFDAFDSGSMASAGLQMLAEDGDPSGVSGSFTGITDGVILGPVTVPGQPPIYHPGEMGMMTFDIGNNMDVYLSYLSMVIPSNDAFIGNDDPMAIKVVDGGIIQPMDIIVMGSMVWDAGTEVNDEVPLHTPLLGQVTPNTGVDEGGMVGLHGGFIPGGNILTAFPDADFTAAGYQVARITVIPEPTSLILMVLGAAGLRARRKR